jgi:outer membrane receptor for ferrienterochelin and colicins
MLKKSIFAIVIITLIALFGSAQSSTITGMVKADGQPIEFVSVSLINTALSNETDISGQFKIDNVKAGKYKIRASYIGYIDGEKVINVKSGETLQIVFDLVPMASVLDEVVVTGTLKEVRKLESPVAVEVFTPVFFKKNPTPNIYDALQNVNGVRPQINCQVCNTGDIHINGLEGPYTMVLVDGMPIVSSLSTVYGLSGIPNSLVDRIEIVKGPASSLYGSEAVGGLINVITKNPTNAPIFTADVFGTSWGEYNADLGFKMKAGKLGQVLTGINYFNFQQKIDKNNDHFTDMTLQNRVSFFQKWNIKRASNRIFSMAGRYMYEDRWGGDTRWNKRFRGGDSLYGESIYTNRFELLGNYQLPTTEKLMLTFSYNDHRQNSYYGTTSYQAQQNIGFSQLTWDKLVDRHDLLLGLALRYTYYDDNTASTADSIGLYNQPQKTWLPGIFIQDELAINKKHKLLLGLRYDYNSYHGDIYTPRLAYKWTFNDFNILRVNAGTGFRVVNLFTEDHAALTGARKVVIKNELNPEQSYNVNVNFVKKIYSRQGHYYGIDGSTFYTYFDNRIVGDFDTDPNKILYDNLQGYAISKGFTLNLDMAFSNGIKIITGGTLMENTLTDQGVTTQQILTENFTGTWSVSYKIKGTKVNIDYTGNVYSPMRLPLLGLTDPRSPTSPWWSIQNIQFTYDGSRYLQIFGGVKNFLNFTPNRHNPFIIARSNDPFDKKVQFDNNGQALITPENPYGLTFDPNYVYAPNQGIRFFLGMRISVK